MPSISDEPSRLGRPPGAQTGMWVGNRSLRHLSGAAPHAECAMRTCASPRRRTENLRTASVLSAARLLQVDATLGLLSFQGLLCTSFLSVVIPSVMVKSAAFASMAARASFSHCKKTAFTCLYKTRGFPTKFSIFHGPALVDSKNMARRTVGGGGTPSCWRSRRNGRPRCGPS